MTPPRSPRSRSNVIDDPDPFVLLVLRRQPGSEHARVTATCWWDEMEAHGVAERQIKPGQRVWLLDPDELTQHEYTEGDK